MELALYALLQMERNLSCNLRQLRLDHHMTVEEMAELMELSPETVAAIENRQFPVELRLSHLNHITRRFPQLTGSDLLTIPPEGW